MGNCFATKKKKSSKGIADNPSDEQVGESVGASVDDPSNGNVNGNVTGANVTGFMAAGRNGHRPSQRGAQGVVSPRVKPTITMPVFRNPPNTEQPISVTYHLTATGVAQTLHVHSNEPTAMMPLPTEFARNIDPVIQGQIPQSFFDSQFNTQPWMHGSHGIQPGLGNQT